MSRSRICPPCLRRFARSAVGAGALVSALTGCAHPRSSTDSTSGGEPRPPAQDGSPARLSFGATAAQAADGHTSSFPLAATPDLVLHAILPGGEEDGKTLVIRGLDPQGDVVWSYPHLQRGTSFDAVIPIFGSAAARKHLAGRFRFEVTAPGGAVIAEGEATLTAPGSRP